MEYNIIFTDDDMYFELPYDEELQLKKIKYTKYMKEDDRLRVLEENENERLFYSFESESDFKKALKIYDEMLEYYEIYINVNNLEKGIRNNKRLSKLYDDMIEYNVMNNIKCNLKNLDNVINKRIQYMETREFEFIKMRIILQIYKNNREYVYNECINKTIDQKRKKANGCF